jgi:hypothetical protein
MRTFHLTLDTGVMHRLTEQQVRALTDALWNASIVPGAALAAMDIALAMRNGKFAIELDAWQSRALVTTRALDAAIGYEPSGPQREQS